MAQQFAEQGFTLPVSELQDMATSAGGRFEDNIGAIIFDGNIRVFTDASGITIESEGEEPRKLEGSYLRRRETGFDVIKPYPGEAPLILRFRPGEDIARQLPR